MKRAKDRETADRSMGYNNVGGGEVDKVWRGQQKVKLEIE